VGNQGDNLARYAAITYDSRSDSRQYYARRWNRETTSYICQLQQQGMFRHGYYVGLLDIHLHSTGLALLYCLIEQFLPSTRCGNNKKLSYCWQTARHICANAMAWLTSLNTPLPIYVTIPNLVVLRWRMWA